MPGSPGGRWRGRLPTLTVMQGVLPAERSRVPADALAAALSGLAVAGSERYVRLAGLAALLAGLMLLAARLARLGFLANFLARTVLVGFLVGVGIQVAIGQLPDMLGVAVKDSQTLPRLLDTVRALPDAHWADVVLSAGVIVVVGVQYGIALAVVASIVDHLRHSYSPLNSVLVKSPAGHWRPDPITTPRARRSRPSTPRTRRPAGEESLTGQTLVQETRTAMTVRRFTRPSACCRPGTPGCGGPCAP